MVVHAENFLYYGDMSEDLLSLAKQFQQTLEQAEPDPNQVGRWRVVEVPQHEVLHLLPLLQAVERDDPWAPPMVLYVVDEGAYVPLRGAHHFAAGDTLALQLDCSLQEAVEVLRSAYGLHLSPQARVRVFELLGLQPKSSYQQAKPVQDNVVTRIVGVLKQIKRHLRKAPPDLIEELDSIERSLQHLLNRYARKG
jgi:hypothetical protein